MDAIYPITALQKNQREVKAAADKGIVRITEHGVGAYIFSSEKAYEESIQKAVEEALFDMQLRNALLEGEADIEAGRIYSDVDAFFDDARSDLNL